MKVFIPGKKAEEIPGEIINSLIKQDEEIIRKLEYSNSIICYKQDYILMKGEPKTLVKNVY